MDLERLKRAYNTARRDLLAERTPDGHWEGRLSSSALSTATAVSALSLMRRHARGGDSARWTALVERGLAWIVAQQNRDGGWGDTDLSRSNIATTMLVEAAFHLAGVADQHRPMLDRASSYVERAGGLAGLAARYGKDKTFSVPILTNAALAGLVPWEQVAPLPFEAACLPQSWYRLARLPVVSYAIPALVAIGQARFFHRPPRNPLVRAIRRASVERSLHVLRRMQPASGGYLEATPLTSFVVMSLASIGRADHAVAENGARFLVDSAREDGSWPIDSNLATWVTSLSINAIGTRGDRSHLTPELLAWLLDCQHTERHPFTGAEPGGWGWSDLSGAVPDADDTPGALLALRHWDEAAKTTRNVGRADGLGRHWLLGLQNGDGGTPTFCRGWGKLPFDRSGTDLTAHAIRSLSGRPESGNGVQRALKYLARTQRADGAWVPLWFGNQFEPGEENPVYGTARVLLAYRDLNLLSSEPARRGLRYLVSRQNADGGWGAAGNDERETMNEKVAAEAEGARASGPAAKQSNDPPSPSFSAAAQAASTPSPQPLAPSPSSSVEETALAIEALAAVAGDPMVQPAWLKGLNWLVERVENGSYQQPAPIGLYFAKLWYYERLYPIIFTVAALGQAIEAWERKPPVTGDGHRS
ncbi:MAG: squalene--hopene cyclase [Planctomycetes bacterium]|nr:squalene--hopene cyclase [Planctomycetota bacterium]